jgi:cytochrome c-type biogenesis protein
LSFFSPCVLPLIPSYFSFICGYSIEELTNENVPFIGGRVLISTLFFVCGFSFVFILMGASASVLGNLFFTYKGPVRIIGGVVIILLGIHLTGLFRFRALDFEKRFHIKKRPLQIFGSFLIGMAFAAGWSPCIGPLLGAILILAGNQETIGQGVALLGIYSLGLAIPFILFSIGINYMFLFITKVKKVLKYLNPVAGMILIIVGFLLVTNNLNRLAGYLQEII